MSNKINVKSVFGGIVGGGIGLLLGWIIGAMVEIIVFIVLAPFFSNDWKAPYLPPALMLLLAIILWPYSNICP